MLAACRTATQTAPRRENRRTLPSGSRLGRYEVLSLLGSGGMGQVYRARDPILNREVALKILREAMASDPRNLIRFEREAKAASALSDPNVVVIFDVGREGAIPYLVSELVEGETLRDLLSAQRLSLRRTLDLAVQIASGLAAAHDRGIVHRDLKPGNILISRTGEAKIADFGLAKLTDPSGLSPVAASKTETAPTAQGVILGTVGYMAPEQVRAEGADLRSDIFSFGCVLYEMATGRPAFAGETPIDTVASILRDEPPSLWEIDASLPSELDRILGHCIEKNPQQRFQSARDLAFALRAVPSDCSRATRRGRRAAVSRRPPLASALTIGMAFLRTILLTIP